MTVDLQKLDADLKIDEGFESYPYDDKTEKRIVKGDTIEGTATFGYGFTFLTEEESAVVLSMRSKKTADAVLARFPWAAGLSEARQRALTDMAYNLGVAGLASFNTFMGMMEADQFEEAADDLKTTKWYQEVGSRAVRIEALIRNG